jgi:hypothetical protein
VRIAAQDAKCTDLMKYDSRGQLESARSRFLMESDSREHIVRILHTRKGGHFLARFMPADRFCGIARARAGAARIFLSARVQEFIIHVVGSIRKTLLLSASTRTLACGRLIL